MERSPRPWWIICRTIRDNVCIYFWLDLVNVLKSYLRRLICADHHQSMYSHIYLHLFVASKYEQHTFRWQPTVRCVCLLFFIFPTHAIGEIIKFIFCVLPHTHWIKANKIISTLNQILYFYVSIVKRLVGIHLQFSLHHIFFHFLHPMDGKDIFKHLRYEIRTLCVG